MLRSIEGPTACDGRSAEQLLSWLRRLLPARLFEPGLRKAFALDPSSRGAALTEPRTHP